MYEEKYYLLWQHVACSNNSYFIIVYVYVMI
jgi:hypothetical protein